MKLGLLAATFFLGTAILTGCILGGSHDIEARVEVENKRISLIPFREKDLYFLESKHGSDVAGLVVQLILKNAFDPKIVDPRPAFEMIENVPPGRIDWGKVATVLDVDYVVVGSIETFRARDPERDVNCYRGEMSAALEVWRRDGTLALTELVKANYPSGKFDLPVVSMFDATESEVLGRLKMKLAEKVARYFYAYSLEE